jgi:hypothetical protein
VWYDLPNVARRVFNVVPVFRFTDSDIEKAAQISSSKLDIVNYGFHMKPLQVLLRELMSKVADVESSVATSSVAETDEEDDPGLDAAVAARVATLETQVANWLTPPSLLISESDSPLNQLRTDLEGLINERAPSGLNQEVNEMRDEITAMARWSLKVNDKVAKLAQATKTSL